MDELGTLGPEPSDADLAADEEVGEPPPVGELFAYMESQDTEEREDAISHALQHRLQSRALLPQRTYLLLQLVCHSVERASQPGEVIIERHIDALTAASRS